nr:PilZ domain-containing protein [uncultured Sphingomonas sp.]
MRTPGKIKRAPRIDAQIKATVVDSDGNVVAAEVLDISKEGCRLRTEAFLRIGETIQIVTEDKVIHPAQVRWALGGEAGAKFAEPVKLGDDDQGPVI